ncbi:MAG: hypothetical protein E6441_12855 [Clostridium sp.]|uniref:hypothetical protein n=1 Tax=Clostridium sp. TaxID=1506 RepID=UPI00290A8CB4|nr:hypothetical protein [Clostridium sp.]MDU4787620.1 hypothetical protein [Clostridium sp.]MDU5210219.1 hypothetical protein [Clostridium sp.]MDU6762346.1 hypothetical protein [Clostridium sp.]
MDEVLFQFMERVTIKNRPMAVPYNYRPIYKVSELVLILLNCCPSNKGCSAEKLHIISNVIKNEDDLSTLLDFFDDYKNTLLIIRYDPVVNRALRFAVGEGLVKIQKNGLMRLTKSGKKFGELLKDNDSLFKKEKKITEKISYRLTEEKINKILLDWRINDVEIKQA